MPSYIEYQRSKWEAAQRESRSLTPMGAAEDIDVIKRWSLMKGEIAKAQGTYPCEGGYQCQNGQAVARGHLIPRLTWNQARALVDEWIKLGTDLGDHLVKAGRDHRYVTDDITKLQTKYGQWSMSATSGENGYLSLTSADYLISALDEYVIGLSSGVWAGYNIENAWERMVWSLKATLKEWAGFIDRFIPNPTPWIELFKWASIAGGLAMLWWVIKPEKKKGAR